jgi:dTDP-4-dehydrorhamnose 3,5-epimerase
VDYCIYPECAIDQRQHGFIDKGNDLMKLVETKISDVKIIEPDVFGDDRGFFLELWNKAVFAEAGLPVNFVQDNHSRSARGILRGLHYQTENTQGKLVRATSGVVFDVAVDMRKSSTTFGAWVGVELSDQNHRMLWVPEGFAHGFYVLSEYADFQYKCTDRYSPHHEISLSWNDPDIGIDWPVPAGDTPLLSEKDKHGLAFNDAPHF